MITNQRGDYREIITLNISLKMWRVVYHETLKLHLHKLKCAMQNTAEIHFTNKSSLVTLFPYNMPYGLNHEWCFRGKLL